MSPVSLGGYGPHVGMPQWAHGYLGTLKLPSITAAGLRTLGGYASAGGQAGMAVGKSVNGATHDASYK